MESATADEEKGSQEQRPSAGNEAAVGSAEVCLLCASFLGIFLFSGIIFGWGPMQLLLEADGVYSGVCGDAPGCDAQSSRLLFLYTLGSTSAVIASLPAGFLVDCLGPLICSVLSGSICCGGLLLLGLGSPEGGDMPTLDLLAAGSILVGSGGGLLFINSMPLAFILPSRMIPFAMATTNALFDGSSVIFLGLYQVYARAKLSRAQIFVGYAILCFVVHLCIALAWRGSPLARLRSAKAAEKADADPKRPSIRLSMRPRLHGKTFMRQIRSFEFLFVAFFLSTQLFRSNTYLGTNKEILQGLGDEATGWAYTQIFMIILPCAVLLVPLISRCLRKYGFVGAFLTVILLGITWNVLTLIPVLEVQPLTFVSFTSFRAFLYATSFTYLTYTFGSRTCASINGAITPLAATLNALIWPLVAASELLPGFGLQGLYFAILALNVPTGVLLYFLRRRLRCDLVGDCMEMADAEGNVAKMCMSLEEDKPSLVDECDVVSI